MRRLPAGVVSLLISGGSGTTTFAAIDINGRRDIGISIESATNVTTGTVDIDNSNSVSGIVAFLISGQTGGSLNFGTTTINNNGAGSGIAVAIESSNATITFASGSNITGTTTTGFNVNQGSGSITYNGAITNTAGSAVSVTSRTGGTVAFTGNINSSGGGTGITVGSNSGGAIVNFSGSTKSISSGSSTGVNLTSNTGATINFTNGGLAITTTSGTGFSATGGGTVTVQGTGNSINSSSATALNVNATTIGGSGLTFQSISSSGTSKGISLNTTGSGGLTVTGTSTTDGTGGTIQNITTRGAEFISAQNITLKNMNFTNACTADFPAAPTGHSLGNNTADNAAIHLQDATTVVLDNLNITTSAEQGINGHNVNGFTLSNSVLSGLGGGPDEDGLHFYNMVGTCAITNTSITSSGDDNVNIQNNTTPSLRRPRPALLISPGAVLTQVFWEAGFCSASGARATRRSTFRAPPSTTTSAAVSWPIVLIPLLWM
ncbi:MAG: hypothetical protein IPL27_00465 [Lewinellaceae bacterium]|nr:hypothetical protein [Lewinellaceae bacterium]